MPLPKFDNLRPFFRNPYVRGFCVSALLSVLVWAVAEFWGRAALIWVLLLWMLLPVFMPRIWLGGTVVFLLACIATAMAYESYVTSRPTYSGVPFDGIAYGILFLLGMEVLGVFLIRKLLWHWIYAKNENKESHSS